MRSYFTAEAERIRDRFGEFVLINTNFGAVNHYFSNLGSLNPMAETLQVAPGDDFTPGFARHRHAIFSYFLKLVPMLAEAFPAHTVIVRPHPVENHAPWLSAARDHANVRVLHEGSVLSWLMAARALVHNSCTTGVEAFLLGVPCVAYQPLQSERFDVHLPNALSYRACDFQALCATLSAILGNDLGPCSDSAKQRLIEHFVCGMEGPLASERIVDVLERSEAASRGLDRPPGIQLAKGRLTAHLRVIEKTVKGRIPSHRNSPEFFRHRFPGITLDELIARIGRFEGLLSRFHNLKALQVSKHIFKITAG